MQSEDRISCREIYLSDKSSAGKVISAQQSWLEWVEEIILSKIKAIKSFQWNSILFCCCGILYSSKNCIMLWNVFVNSYLHDISFFIVFVLHSHWTKDILFWILFSRRMWREPTNLFLRNAPAFKVYNGFWISK